MMTQEQRYALRRVKAGGYLLPSNDARVWWRIARYTDGPSGGLDLPRDQEFWGVWRWRQIIGDPYIGLDAAPDTGDWDQWEFWNGLHTTRASAVAAALRASEPS